MDHLTPVKTALLVERQAMSACRVKVRRSLSIYQLTPRRPASPSTPASPPPCPPSLCSISSPPFTYQPPAKSASPLISSILMIRSSYRRLATTPQTAHFISVCLHSGAVDMPCEHLSASWVFNHNSTIIILIIINLIFFIFLFYRLGFMGFRCLQ